MGLIELGTGVLTGQGEPEQFPAGGRVTPNFLDLMGGRSWAVPSQRQTVRGLIA